MIVVSDTSPLNYLVLIDCAQVLPALFGRVLAPPAVIRELGHSRAPAVVRSWAESPPEWLEVRAPGSVRPDVGLGPGEVEAISLALELKADALLIDERQGCRAAEALGLFVAGTVGVLELAAHLSMIDLKSALDALVATSFRVSDQVIADALARDEHHRRKHR